MPANFKDLDRDTGFLMPPDVRDWVARDDLAHFLVEAVQSVPIDAFKVNRRGSGSAQYPPRAMLALLVYCYSRGITSSRRIEEATYHHAGVRLIMANTHPDHDTIATFRRVNGEAFEAAFLQILLLAQEVGLLKLGKISIDGTRMKADASLNQNVTYDRSEELIEQLKADIAALAAQAEADDRDPDPDDRLPAELQRREKLLAKLEAARAALEQRARERAQREHAAYRKAVADRAGRDPRGRQPKPPPPVAEARPRGGEQVNLTDPDSRVMSKRGQTGQQYNAQAAVDAEGSMLILAALLVQGGDMGQLLKVVDAIDPALGQPTAVLADTGYAKASDIAELERRGLDPHVAVEAKDLREYEFRPKKGEPKPPKHFKQPELLAMREKLATDEGRSVYRLRQQTVEPAFGVMKEVMGLRGFRMRGLVGASGEWTLMALSYNLKRIHRWKMAA